MPIASTLTTQPHCEPEGEGTRQRSDVPLGRRRPSHEHLRSDDRVEALRRPAGEGDGAVNAVRAAWGRRRMFARRRTRRRIVLCRPHEGLNDTLVQIERCWSYAERTGRDLVIDGSHSFFRGRLWDSLVLRDGASRIAVHDVGDVRIPPSATTVPSALPGGLAYRTTIGRFDGRNRRVLAADGRPITFDFERDHDEDVLVHEAWGGGWSGHLTLARLRLAPWLRDLVLARTAALPEDYSAIHVRNTDLRTDVDAFLASVAPSLGTELVVVCSDDASVLERARRLLGDVRVESVAHVPDLGGRPVHHARGIDVRHLVGEAFVDLMAMAGARRLFTTEVLGRGGLRASGFSILARSLNERPEVVDRLLWRG